MQHVGPEDADPRPRELWGTDLNGVHLREEDWVTLLCDSPVSAEVTAKGQIDIIPDGASVMIAFGPDRHGYMDFLYWVGEGRFVMGYEQARYMKLLRSREEVSRDA
ncbi:MAG TPA: hypothetical protein VEH07_03880 [Alphaproteobacteria bacterium]|nr:hypothetical protein [Alphaproteobacteria bacterium]